MLRYLAAPAYVLGMMAVILGPLWAMPYTGPAPEWFSTQKPKPKPVVNKADKFQGRPVKVEIIRKDQK